MKNVRQLTEGAVLLAATTVLILISIYVPIAGPFVALALPAPFLMFSAKNNLRYILAFTVAAILISFMATNFLGLAMTLIYGSAGIVIGYQVQKNQSRNAILIVSSLTFMIGTVLFYSIAAAFLQLDIVHELTKAMNESVKSSEKLLNGMGQTEQVAKLKEQNATMAQQVITLAPSLLIFISVFSSFVTQWICFPIVKRFGVKVQPWGSFRNLSLPKSLLWYYLIALGAMLLFHPAEGTYFYSVLINARVLLETLVIIQGLAFAFYIFHQKSLAKGLGVLVVILTFMIPIVRYIIMLLGITDLGFDFRKQFEKKE